MTEPCDVSVVLCTYKRAALLGRALDALMRQTYDPAKFEVIVVDNNSRDTTSAVVAERAGRHPPIRYVFEPRQGLPLARNTGMRHARASIIAFTDDDVEVAPEWVSAIKRRFDRHPEIGYIGGKVVPLWERGAPPAWVPATHYGPLALQNRGDAVFTVGGHDARACLIGANFAVRRSVFDRAGLFSPAYPWSEDREFQLRAWSVGIQGLYVPDAIATCRVPVERLTKTYQRQWFAKAGRVHADMRLLERMDSAGRLVDPVEGRRVCGVPGYLFREVSKEALSWIAAMARRQPARAFQHENRMRYLVSYIFECRRRAAVPLEADLSLASSQQPERDSRYTAISGQPTAAR